jgi:hypothetical protein
MTGRPQAERTGVSESNPVVIPLVPQRGVSTSLDMTALHFRSATIKFASL